MNKQLRVDPLPDQLYKAFRDVADEHKADVIATWGDKHPERTSLMLHKILPAIAQKLDLDHAAESYWIDMIFYNGHTTRYRPTDKWAKYISVALEHENVSTTAAEEVIRLQRVNTPLAVLITYPPTEQSGKQLLDTFAGIIKDADVFENASTQRRQICIFGYPGPDWRGFVYQDEDFSPWTRPSPAHSRPSPLSETLLASRERFVGLPATELRSSTRPV